MFNVIYSRTNLFVLFTQQFIVAYLFNKIIVCLFYFFKAKFFTYGFFSHIYKVIIYFQVILFLENNTTTLFYKKTKIFDEPFKSSGFLFLRSYCHILLAHYLLKQIQHD